MAEETGIEPDPITQANRLAGGLYHQIEFSSVKWCP